MSKKNQKISDLISSDQTAQQILKELRLIKPAQKEVEWVGKTTGQRVSDAVAKVVGSWTFIILQSVILVLWMFVNVLAWVQVWDPYPFILLNLALSFQAAFTAPIIMMSQNRQNAIDRQRAQTDYEINVKAELEIEELHEKIDLLRTQEIKQLLDIIQALEKKLDKAPD